MIEVQNEYLLAGEIAMRIEFMIIQLMNQEKI